MPRKAREKSNTGVYHVMLRGINQQVIFEDNEDYEKFIEKLVTYKNLSGYKLYSYCLMSNHIHLLLKAEKEDVEKVIKRLAGSYAYWYNWKYYRSGHLFQDRFKSEPVENDSYFLTVLRYIHQNPVKAGIVASAEKYEYSSFNDYVDENANITDIDFLYSIMKKSEFIDFSNVQNTDSCLDIDNIRTRFHDTDAHKILENISCCSATDIHLMEKNERNRCLLLAKQCGLSIRQISRLTGISKKIIERI